MSNNRFDKLGDGNDHDHEEEAIAKLSLLARTHGAESRAADIVAEKALVGRFRYTPALGWLEWDGRRWDADDVAEPRVVETVRQFIDTTERDYRAQIVEAEVGFNALKDVLVQRAKAAPKEEKAATGGEAGDQADEEDRYLKVASNEEKEQLKALENKHREATLQAGIWLNLLSAGKISAITKLCRGMEGVITRTTDFDAHPDLLNVENGVVDLSNGTLMPPNPNLLLTHLAGGEYVPGAKSTLWDKALAAVPVETRDWFQLRLGQSITGHTPDDDSMVVCVGGGENGKSAVMSAIMRACGSYGRLISHRVLIAQPGQHPTELMDLRGLRFALLEETPEEGRLDTHQLKSTVGTPYITARRMRRDDVTFKTSHTLWVNTNFLPQVDTTDHGTWRRLKAMPFPYRFVKPREDGSYALTRADDREGSPTLKPHLEKNPTVPAAVLAWLVEGAMRWYAGERVSPDDPAAVVEATKMWRTATDVGFLFSTERLTADPDSFITAEAMREQFSEFLQIQGKREWSAQLLNQRLPTSLAEAGILVSATPAKASKVRANDKQSVPERNSQWAGLSAPRPADLAPGKVVRMWRGVRFKTEAERTAGHLAAV